jgi:hypothetical protein
MDKIVYMTQIVQVCIVTLISVFINALIDLVLIIQLLLINIILIPYVMDSGV